MKKSLIAAASIALLASAAHAQTAGYVGADWTRANLNPAGPSDIRIDQYQLEGAGAWKLGQLGVSADGQVTDVGGQLEDRVDYALTAHVNTAVMGARVGGFAGVDSGKNQTVWGVGVEGQTRLSPADTLYGQVGYGSSNDLHNPDIWAARAELRHFYTDNFKVQGSVGYARERGGSLVKGDGYSLGLGAEYQFAGTPWSLRAGYDYARSRDLQVTNNAFTVGGRYTFGGATLKARDAAGADLDPIRTLFTGAFRY